MINARVIRAEIEFIEQPFARPLRLSTGVITHLSEARALVTVEANGVRATGRGAIYLSDLWAWPDPKFTHEQRDAVMRGMCEQIAQGMAETCGEGHPLLLGLRLHAAAEAMDDAVPVLARLLCASPFDAALHDAAGIALGRSAFDFYDEPQSIPEADALLEGDACGAIAEMLCRPPRNRIDAWWIVLPGENIPPGYRGYKLKIMGKDVDADVEQTVATYRAAGGPLVVDSNEAHADTGAVLEYLKALQAADADTFDALAYIEQPTHRDIRRFPQDWRPVARLKPVLIDEGLTDFASLQEAKAQGWSGLALKTCKGHSFILVAAAWARRHGMMVALQDLTNPGYAAIHAALFAVNVPTINGCELNSPQFTPKANVAWLPRLQGLFEPKEGVHVVPKSAQGLGSML